MLKKLRKNNQLKKGQNILPVMVSEAVKQQFPNETIIISALTDLLFDATYGKEWVVLTSTRVLIYTQTGDEELESYSLRTEYALSTLADAKAENTVGGGILELITPDGETLRAALYSNTHARRFARLAHSIQSKVQKKDSKQNVVPEEHTKYCETCGFPIPEGMESCPACSKKGRTFTRLLEFSRPYTKSLWVVLLVMILSTLCGLVAPYTSKILVDDVLKPMKNEWMLAPLALALLISYIGQNFLSALHGQLVAILGHKVVYDVRTQLYARLQELSLSFYDKKQTGSLMARVNQDTNEVGQLLVDWLPITTESILTIIGIGFFLCKLSWKLTVIIIIPIIITIWFFKSIWPKVRVYFHRYLETRAKISALVSDTLSGVRVVKAFGQEKAELQKFDEKNIDFRDAGILLEKKWAIYHPISHLLIMLGSVIVWYVGGKFIFAQEMTLGDVIAYSGYLSMFYRPVQTLTRMANTVVNTLSAGERIFDIIETEPEIKDAPDAVEVNDLKGEIEFRNVTFGYNKFKPVITNLSLKIAPNEIVGLAGHSGAGKSTIINLICRLYDTDAGTIFIDGHDVKKIKYADFRKHVGIVLQEPYLFSGTIAENILYAKPNASRNDIIRAAKIANAHDFIIKKPDGYDTNVGERGVRLSVGEKQRISIARAVLSSPRILILDEATSSVDLETERDIQEALERLVTGRTTVVIAHRLSTLRNCHRLLVIEEGKNIEIGTYQELIEKNGAFYKLVKLQEQLSQIRRV
ncbi:MAG: ABC transporter ATP-binding protein [Elusimicrobiota bacterium]